MTMNRGGDVLARGGTSAQFKTSENTVSQEKWNEMFGVDESFAERMKRKALSEGLTEAQYEEAQQVALAEIQKQEEERKQKLVSEQKRIKIRAIQDRIIVRRVESEDRTDAGLYLADESKEKPSEGIVVSVGPGKYIGEQLVPPSVAVGERVVFGKFAGAEVKVGLDSLLVLREEDLFLVKEYIEITETT
jgi:chaperonin GroES